MPIEWITTGLTYGLSAAGGAGAMWFKQWLSDRNADRKIDRETKHLALEIADILEKFAAASTTTISDINDHVAQRSEGYMLSLAKLPAFPKSHERWRDLDLKVVDAIMRLQDTHTAYGTRIDGAVEYADLDDAQEETRVLATLLAVHSLKLAARVRKRYRHAPFQTSAYWPVFLHEQYGALDRGRKRKGTNSFPPKTSWWHMMKMPD